MADTTVTDLARHYAERYGLGSGRVEDGLEYLAIHLTALEEPFYDTYVAGVEPSELDLSSQNGGGGDDLKIDGLLVNEDGTNVAIVQAAHRTKLADELVDKASGFFGNVETWMRAGKDHLGNEQVQNLLEQASLDPTKQEVTLSFYTTLPINTVPAQKLLAKAEEFTNIYQERGWNITCQVLGAAEIVSRNRELTQALSSGVISQPIAIQLPAGTYFELKSPHNAVVATLRARAIADIYRLPHVGNNLFNSNIRFGLTSSTINKEIGATLHDPAEAGNFFYYNNGVTATCSSYDIDAATNVVTIHDLQVVNGAQTVNALRKALKGQEIAPPPMILFRLIATGTKDAESSTFAKAITKFQNTQNPVKSSDFWSNDPFQIWLSLNLAKQLSGKGAVEPFRYLHKRGAETTQAAKGKPLTIQQLAQLRHSVLYGPALSYAAPKSYWEHDAVRYWEAFGVGGKEVASWSTEELYRVGWAITMLFRVKTTAAEIKRDDPESRETLYLDYLARFAVALAHAGVLEAMRTKKVESFESLMHSKETFDRISDQLLKRIRIKLQDEIAARVEQGQANPRLNLGRDDAGFRRIRDSLVGAMKIDPIS
jgi:hypothetical protein